MKKNILKVFAVLLALAILFAVVSCGGKDKDSSETTGVSSVTETEKEETADATENTEKENVEGEITTEKDNQVPDINAGAETNGKDGSAKPGGKDTGKDSGKTENEKQTGGNTTESKKPTGGNTSEPQKPTGGTNGETSGGNQEEKDNEGEFVIPSKEIRLPTVPLK